jgi:shikimate kinase
VATLWLVGMMGSGKTTVAPLAAAALGVRWFDTDDEVAARTGRPAAEIVAEDETRFRAVERDVVATLAGEEAVVACGGGVVLDPTSVAVMKDTGVVMLLDVPIASLTVRVGEGAGRPLLADGPAEALARIAAARRSAYRAAADVVVDGTGAPEEVAARVVGAWASSS